MADFTVLGSAGFIGGHLVRHLRAAGAVVRTPGRDLAALDGQDLGQVVYAIGLTGDFIRRPLDTVEAHVCAFAGLLRRSRFASLLYLSSTRLYDGQPGPAREDATLALRPDDPRHIYDFSKGLGEALCHAMPDRRIVIARLSSVYDDALQADNFLHDLCRRALAAPALEIETAPDAARDYIHVADVCRALQRILEAGRERIYNVASGANLTNGELVALVARATGCRITIRARPLDRPVPRIDVGRLRDELGVAASPPAERIAAMLAGHRPGRRADAGPAR